ncbi:hypothetical protein CKF62_06595 [Corynebacterium striatum]|uniref:hypothetical protein n=1 Tax=Corynebacterium striatum TaxID=43770 RepID=UPI000D76CCFD|nr:hypothetical protein [Corynebacterium striatum]PXY15025.1 hypothetical protein CKF62_06595 [Corynebacterium striatum]
MNSSRSEQRIDEFEVTGVRMMFENSIVCQCTFYYFVVIVIVLTGLGVWLVWCVPVVCQCTFYYFVVIVIVLTGLGVWLVWCVPDRAFFDEGAIVNN